MDIIQSKLLLIEYETVNSVGVNHQKLDAIREIRKALFQIDFMAETVPLESVNNLSKLLSSLKGNKLNKEELKLVKELVNNKS